MSKFTDIDFWFSHDGDFAVDDAGDLKSTQTLYAGSLLQEMRDRVRSSKGDWKLRPNVGANLSSLIGENLTSQLIDRITQRIETELVYDRLLTAGEYEILPLQIGKHNLIFRIVVSSPNGELSFMIGYNSHNQQFFG